MTPRTQKLVRELLGLYAKYGPVEFGHALEALRTGTATALLSEAVEDVARAAPPPRQRASPGQAKKMSPRDRFDDFQFRLALDRTQPRSELHEFIQQIAERSILADARTLRDFAALLEIPTGAKLERYTIARKIGEKLAMDSEESLHRTMKAARDYGGEEGSSLQKWADIIVKR